ncbi:MAG TPA: thiol-disulfide oxidoreductase DCC family protein [Cyclobacteriaceae bacterium]|nr:thiol-disulfide oxidoreductase DCC family protein [Cyclobacteriaceae bacterium]
MDSPAQIEKKGIVLFDGVCNLCNSSVQFIIKRDQRAYFQFAAIQQVDQKILPATFELNRQDPQSLILLEDGKIYERSDAALRIARKLNGLWPILYVLIIIPRFIRNPLYNFVARNRYSWFGRKDQCMLPSPALKARFLYQH